MHLGAAHPSLHSEQPVQASRRVIALTLQTENSQMVFSLHFSGMEVWASSTTAQNVHPFGRGVTATAFMQSARPA
ncbi:hypothetical protein StoSoilB13_04820 [Arthrobacter sp. StoSoilB13]|nr:hypothetical protein StoSoilB13_04820 [Arthrobacter sp. StoSoilB13]